jgi:uroporphyrinogen decarboxylase
MTSSERVLTALSHREADRIPRDLGGTESSGMTACSLSKLQNHLRLESEIKIFDPYQYVGYVGEDIRDRFRIDTFNLTMGPEKWVKAVNPFGFDALVPEKWREELDEKGGTVALGGNGQPVALRPAGSYYYDPVNPPLQDLTDSSELKQHKGVISSFDLPSFADEPESVLQKRAVETHAKGDCVVFNLCCHILAAGQLLRGYENFMVDLMTDEKIVRTLLDYLIEGYLLRIDRLAPLLRDSVDVVLLNDDLGTQNGPMLALATYRELIKPYQKILFTHVKKKFGKPILFHSCGAVREFIPDLIDVGVDALNPVQLSANGMDARVLKHDFGNYMSFWGGGVDTQTVLNKSTPSEVADSVRRNVEIFAPGGGFVFCQVHNIQPDVPPENVVAMYKALDEYGGY